MSEGGPWRANSQAKDWVGIPIATALRLDPDSKADRAKIKGALKIWIANDMFREVEGEDATRNKRTFIEVGTWADQKVETVRMKPSSQKKSNGAPADVAHSSEISPTHRDGVDERCVEVRSGLVVCQEAPKRP